ncbi:TPA: hypothetical protein ACH3X2_007574 [Trebouxia sp. C0005]
MEGAEQDAGPIAQGLNLRGLAQVVQLEDLPSQPLRLQQSGDDLCLYGLNLCWHMHKPHAPRGQGQGASKLPENNAAPGAAQGNWALPGEWPCAKATASSL